LQRYQGEKSSRLSGGLVVRMKESKTASRVSVLSVEERGRSRGEQVSLGDACRRTPSSVEGDDAQSESFKPLKKEAKGRTSTRGGRQK